MVACACGERSACAARKSGSSKRPPVRIKRLRWRQTYWSNALHRHGPTRSLVSDIIYISTGEGWLYLASIKDVFICEVVDYAMGDRGLVAQRELL